MSNSPFIPEQVKSYIRNHNLQKIINSSVNSVLKSCPEDPYAFLIGQFQKLASAQIEIKSITGIQIVSGEGFPAIKVRVSCIFMNKQLTFLLNQPLGILNEQGIIYDQDRHNGKGQKKGIQFLNNICTKISGLKCSQQSEIDKRIIQQFKTNNNLGVYQVNIASYSPSLIKAHLLSKSLYEVYTQIFANQQKSMNVMINCLHGGKAIGSKCKVFKYYLIANNIKDPWIIQSIIQSIRKSITSGKGGQAALKFSPDGTFICPLDTIMDNLKIVEDAINTNNAKDIVSIGLSWMADTLFSVDTKKYELQNPKTPFDNDQMIDYLIKLLTDKPIIQYLEDPLAPTEKTAWKKLISKIKQTEAIKNVKIGSRNTKIFNLNEDNIKEQITQISVRATVDSHPEQNEQALGQRNANKFILDYVQCRPFELKTLSKLVQTHKQFGKLKTKLILQDNNLQTYDTHLIDLCYGSGNYANLGSFNKYDRICKLNRIAQILN